MERVLLRNESDHDDVEVIEVASARDLSDQPYVLSDGRQVTINGLPQTIPDHDQRPRESHIDFLMYFAVLA
jgi:hypothetical protein